MYSCRASSAQWSTLPAILPLRRFATGIASRLIDALLLDLFCTCWRRAAAGLLATSDSAKTPCSTLSFDVATQAPNMAAIASMYTDTDV